MRIEVIDENSDLVINFELTANPFKIGDILNIDIYNYAPQIWNIKEIFESYKIVGIEHFFRGEYYHGNHTEIFVTSITVKKVSKGSNNSKSEP